MDTTQLSTAPPPPANVAPAQAPPQAQAPAAARPAPSVPLQPKMVSNLPVKTPLSQAPAAPPNNPIASANYHQVMSSTQPAANPAKDEGRLKAASQAVQAQHTAQIAVRPKPIAQTAIAVVVCAVLCGLTLFMSKNGF